MTDRQDVLAGLHSLNRALAHESRKLSSVADALFMSGNEALSNRLGGTAERFAMLAEEVDALAGLYVSDAMNAAAASQRSVEVVVLAMLETSNG